MLHDTSKTVCRGWESSEAKLLCIAWEYYGNFEEFLDHHFDFTNSECDVIKSCKDLGIKGTRTVKERSDYAKSHNVIIHIYRRRTFPTQLVSETSISTEIVLTTRCRDLQSR